MDLGIAGRTALVCGGSSGLGLATARRLAAEGARVTISARGQDRLESAADEVRAEGGLVHTVAADHSTASGRAAIFEACPEPDILVTNASPPPVSPHYTDIGVEAWESTLATTLIGPIELMRQFIPGMEERTFGRVVHVSTAGAKFPTTDRLLSGVPRAGLQNYSVAVARRTVRNNVVVNTLLPGLFATQAVKDRLSELTDLSAGLGSVSLPVVGRVPAGRAGDPDEFAAVCALLCSQFAGYMVGQAISIDGGIDRTTF